MSFTPPDHAPTAKAIKDAAHSLHGRVVKTPCLALSNSRIATFLPQDCAAVMKLELFQNAGSFKARGALLSVDALTPEQREKGVTAISAGNHALAVSWACQAEGVSAKVVMPRSADPVRVRGCEAMGAEIVLTRDIHEGFEEMDRIVREEGRVAIHPFEGECLTLGTATCGRELMHEAPDLDAIIVPVGGGGLIGGIGLAAKYANPTIEIIGVEPSGADALTKSLQTGDVLQIDKVDTIADSLGSPKTLPYSFGIAQAVVDDVVRIDDSAMLRAMTIIYDSLKLVTEPACAAATAALIGPLKYRMTNKRVGVIACGANIGEDKFNHFIQQGREQL